MEGTKSPSRITIGTDPGRRHPPERIPEKSDQITETGTAKSR